MYTYTIKVWNMSAPFYSLPQQQYEKIHFFRKLIKEPCLIYEHEALNLGLSWDYISLAQTYLNLDWDFKWHTIQNGLLYNTGSDKQHWSLWTGHRGNVKQVYGSLFFKWALLLFYWYKQSTEKKERNPNKRSDADEQ